MLEVFFNPNDSVIFYSSFSTVIVASFWLLEFVIDMCVFPLPAGFVYKEIYYLFMNNFIPPLCCCCLVLISAQWLGYGTGR